MAKGIKTEQYGWIKWPDGKEESESMKEVWIGLAILAYIGIGWLTYNFTYDYGYSSGESFFTATVWPVFWVYVIGG